MIDEFYDLFINEAKESIVKLENNLLLLETDTQNKELIDNIFRVMHNLKGAAQMYGFEDMHQLTHEFENIFDRIRSNQLCVSKVLIDDTLKAKDFLSDIIDQKNLGEHGLIFLKTLESKYNSGNSESLTDKTEKSISNSKQETSVFCIVFSPDVAIFERGLNPELVLKDLEAIGATRVVVHEKESNWELQKAKKICHTAWEIYLATLENESAIESILLFYDSDEFYIANLSQLDTIEDPDFLKILAQYYSNQSLDIHLKKCTQTAINQFIPSNFKRHTRESEESNLGVLELEDAAEEQPDETSSIEPHSDSKIIKANRESHINVSAKKLDDLMNLVSELVIYNSVLDAYSQRIKDEQLSALHENFEKLTKKFRTSALDLRLISMGTLLNKFNRQVRDLSDSLGKKVNLIIEGSETEVDKTVLRTIENSLTHIIRNSIDHGIETPDQRIASNKSSVGILKIVATHSSDNVVIQIHDDGQGIDLEKIRKTAIAKGKFSADQHKTDKELLNLIMEPGFSTSDQISLVSGRGVGMDVVKRELNEIGGSILIETEDGLGTSVTLKLPTTLSIIDTLLLDVNHSNILIPLLDVEYCYKEKPEKLHQKNSQYIEYKGDMIPFVSLRKKFNYVPNNKSEEMVVIVNKFEKRFAVIVDDVIREQQAVIKPLGELFANQAYFSGGSMMVDGSLALVLDTNYLFYDTE